MNQPITGVKRQAALGFIFVTATMDVLSLGVMIPVLPNLVKMLGGGDTATAADWVVLFATVWGVMQFFCSPILGLMSDRFGRRPVILTSIFGLGVDFLFMAFAPNLWWLFIGRIFNGMTAASFSTASAYVADVTTPENRAKGFGLMGAAFGVGFTFGPMLGGFLWQFDHRLPFLVCAGLALLNWLYGFFVLPESLPPERRQPRFNWNKANPIGSLHLLQRHPGLLGLAGVGFLFQLAHNVLPSVFVLYMGFRYGWGPNTVGATLMASGVAGILVQALIVGRVVKAVGERDRPVLGLRWLHDLRSGADRFPLSVRLAVLRPDRSDPAGLAGTDDPPRAAQRAGAAAGRQFGHDGHRLDRRAAAVPAAVRLRHPSRRDPAPAGPAGADRRGVDAGRDHPRLCQGPSRARAGTASGVRP